MRFLSVLLLVAVCATAQDRGGGGAAGGMRGGGLPGGRGPGGRMPGMPGGGMPGGRWPGTRPPAAGKPGWGRPIVQNLVWDPFLYSAFPQWPSLLGGYWPGFWGTPFPGFFGWNNWPWYNDPFGAGFPMSNPPQPANVTVV